MNSEFVKQLRAEHERVQSELLSLNSRVSSLNERNAGLESLLKVYDTEDSDSSAVSNAGLTPAPKAAGRRTVTDVVIDILTEADTAISTEKLLLLLQEEGATVGGQNPEVSLATVLEQSDRFSSMPDHSGWILTSRLDDFAFLQSVDSVCEDSEIDELDDFGDFGQELELVPLKVEAEA